MFLLASQPFTIFGSPQSRISDPNITVDFLDSCSPLASSHSANILQIKIISLGYLLKYDVLVHAFKIGHFWGSTWLCLCDVPDFPAHSVVMALFLSSLLSGVAYLSLCFSRRCCLCHCVWLVFMCVFTVCACTLCTDDSSVNRWVYGACGCMSQLVSSTRCLWPLFQSIRREIKSTKGSSFHRNVSTDRSSVTPTSL